jgi:hypothetical protein
VKLEYGVHDAKAFNDQCAPASQTDAGYVRRQTGEEGNESRIDEEQKGGDCKYAKTPSPANKVQAISSVSLFRISRPFGIGEI